MNLVRKLTAVALVSLSGLAVAAPAQPTTTPQARAEVRHDNRDIARDKNALAHERVALHRAERAHDYRRVNAIRHQMHHQRVTLHHDRIVRHHDARDLRHG